MTRLRWPWMTRARHDREIVRLAIAHGHELAGQHQAIAPKLRSDVEERAAAWLRGRADAHDLDADKLDGRAPGGKRLGRPLDATDHRVIADELRELARDVVGHGGD